MKTCQKIALFVGASVFLIGLWIESWLGPEEDDAPWDETPPPE